VNGNETCIGTIPHKTLQKEGVSALLTSSSRDAETILRVLCKILMDHHAIQKRVQVHDFGGKK
jgi:hypothetical protein